MERGKIDYGLIYKIEGKYGSLTNCPEEDEDLKELRRKLKVGEDVRGTRSGSWRDWLKSAEKYHDKNK